MLKIIQRRLQPFVERELPDTQAGFRKGRGTRDIIADARWTIEKAREYQKEVNMCFIDYSKAFDCVDHIQMWKILRKMGVSEHLITLIKNLYIKQEATVKTDCGKTDWFQIGKGVRQGCILSPYLFNLYAKHIIREAGLEEDERGFKVGGRNINNLRYTDDMTLMAEKEEDLKGLLEKIKEQSEKVDLHLNIKKTKIMSLGGTAKFSLDGEEIEVVESFCLLEQSLTTGDLAPRRYGEDWLLDE